MTQRELARKVGVTDGFIAHIESGRTLPGREKMKALALALGVPEARLLRESGYLSAATTDDEDIIEDPELRLFFREEWQHLTTDEKDWFKGFVRMLKEKRREKLARGD
jgi:transcriptional regulator with XRE-family HTH domain